MNGKLAGIAVMVFAAPAVGATGLVEASSSSMAQAGPQPVSSFAAVRDGALVVGGNSAAANGSSNAGPIGSGVMTAFADTSQIDGSLSSTALASANRIAATLRNYAEAGDGGGATLATANSRWVETITFNNQTGGTVPLDFSWTTQGAVTDLNGTALGSQNITSLIQLSGNNLHPSSISLQGMSPGVLGGAAFNYGTFGGPGGVYFTFPPQGNNNAGAWQVAITGAASGVVSSTLLVPPGLAAIDIEAALSLDCRTGAICDFSSGAGFQFGPLPAGLSWSSESGVFLQSDTDADGVVDAGDNCTLVANAGQRDSDGDGIGNACDADMAPGPQGDCVVNALDLGALKQAFFATPASAHWNPHADFNADDVVNVLDLGTLKAGFFMRPGPSGISNLCAIGAE